MIETIITSSVLILIILALRYLLQGKISSRLQYALWVLVAVRLLLPFSLFESPISVMNAILDMQSGYSATGQPVASTNSGKTVLSPENSPTVSDSPAVYDNHVASGTEVDVKAIAQFIWLCGVIFCGVFFAASNIRLIRMLKKDRKLVKTLQCPLPVYMVSSLPSPCLYGILYPVICVTPESLSDEQRAEYVLAHEVTHFRQKDYIWSFVRVLCLCIHWFNPLVWLAAVLSRRDSELSCDERTLRRIGPENRVEYGRTLIEMMTSPSKPSDIFCCATTMTGGKGEMTERIKRIAKQPKTLMISLVTVVATIVGAFALTFGSAHNVTLADTVDFSLEPLNELKYATLIFDNESKEFSALAAEEIVLFIKELRVGRKEIEQSRDVDRNKSNQIHFVCEGVLKDGTNLDMYFNFNSDFTVVWIDDGIKPSYSYAVAKPKEVKAFFERQLGISQATLQELWNARTPYVGNDSGNDSIVGKLLGLLPLPEGLRHDSFSLRTITASTIQKSGSIKWTIKGDKTVSYKSQQFDLDALLLFALIDNLEEFYISIEGTPQLEYNRTWADKLVGGDVQEYAESPERLRELIRLSASDVPSYSISKLENGLEGVEYSLDGQLADTIIMDVIVKSAAWEGVDVYTLKECFVIHQTFSQANDGQDYFAYLLEDGRAVLQSGTDGRYSILSQELYLELIELWGNLTMDPWLENQYTEDIPRPDFDTMLWMTVDEENEYCAASYQDVSQEQIEEYLQMLNNYGWKTVRDLYEHRTLGGLYQKDGHSISIQFDDNLVVIYFSLK